MKNVTVMKPDVFTDHRGTIRSFFPDENIVEYNLMITKKGDERGYHFHPHFIEYMLVVEGVGKFREYGDEVHEVLLHVGDSIRIPKDTAHTFIALTDFKFVSMLTKRWNDSNPPIIKVDENGNEITS